MANTKSISDRTERKNKKRDLRKALKRAFSHLTTKQKKAYRRSETVGLRAWIAEQAKGD